MFGSHKKYFDMTQSGLMNGATGDVLNNIEVAYDETQKRYYIVSDCHTYPTDGGPLFVSSAFR